MREAVGKRPGRRWRRWLARAAAAALAVGLAAAGGAGWAWWRYVVQEPGEHLAESAILARISRESPVFSRDGTHRIGVFFQGEHRRYVRYDEVPGACVDAIVSSEDKRFFTHLGLDPAGIARAMWQNVRAGEVVAGGSSLTQQTAKNIFDRRDRSPKEKWRELVNALRLEAHYSKEKILEFYLNQFYVNGNGRGLGIAARYFFDKDVPDLTPLECAFLAGSVRSPNHYNPFGGDSDAQRQRALARAHARTRYVLGRMHEDGKLSSAEHAALATQEIPFRRGRFRYRESVVLDQVGRELDQPEVRRALQAHGIDNPAQAGLNVVTTIDRVMQEGAVHALRHHLTEVGVLLEGPQAVGLLSEAAPPDALRPEDVRPGTFFEGRIESVDLEAGEAWVDLGGIRGVVDREGLTRMARLLLRGRKGVTWGDPAQKDVAELLSVLAAAEPGRAGVLVSVRDLSPDGTPRLDLEYPTELQGAVLVLDRGRVRAMVGGSDNRNFNRATQARRQFGSTFKPIVMAAALQLGWELTDELDNRRAVFPYQGTFYWPRPDHEGAPGRVSLAWAGVTSENLASVSLLYHLTDPLDPVRLERVAERAGMTRRPGEDRDAYVARIRDRMGIVPTREKVREGLFEEAAARVAAERAEAGEEDLARALRTMAYGLGYDAERGRIGRDATGAERAIRREVLARSFLKQQEVLGAWREARPEVERWLAGGGPAPSAAARLCLLPERDGSPARLSFGDLRPEGCAPATAEAILAVAPVTYSGAFSAPGAAPAGGTAEGAGGTEDGEAEDDRPAVLAPVAVPDPLALLYPARMVLDGQLSPALVEELARAVDEADAALGDGDLFEWDRLRRVRDFRTLVGIRYVAEMARVAGVESPIQPVLSLPLGSSDVTLLDVGLVYDALLDGRASRFDGGSGRYGLISEVCAPLPGDTTPEKERALGVELCRTPGHTDQRMIYRASWSEDQVFSPVVGAELGQVLRNVVAQGTGRRAEGAVRAAPDGPSVPLFGKTGTTNSYTNAAFVGWVPRISDGQTADLASGFTVAAYVGYDDNRKMARKGVRIAGATGSLPAWILAAQAVVSAQGAAPPAGGEADPEPSPLPGTGAFAASAPGDVPFGPDLPPPEPEGGASGSEPGPADPAGGPTGDGDAAATGTPPDGGEPEGGDGTGPDGEAPAPAAYGGTAGDLTVTDLDDGGGEDPGAPTGIDPTAFAPPEEVAGPALVAISEKGLAVLYPPGLVPVMVDRHTGLPVPEGGVVILRAPARGEARFRPFESRWGGRSGLDTLQAPP